MLKYDESMHVESNYPTYTIGAVADAIGIPVNTLRTWCQRGFGPRVANVLPSGEWRRYTAEMVAEFVALKRLSAAIELHPAQMALWDIIDAHAENWCNAVRAAHQQSGPMLIGISRYQGVEKSFHFFYPGDHLAEFARTMGQPLEASCEGRYLFCPVLSLLILDVGPAVSAAMKALHR
jgi:hypothetical protein